MLFAIPDEETRSNKYEIAIPNLASIILTHEVDGELQGLMTSRTLRHRSRPFSSASG
nr:cytochrome ubiquinol oxidase subunit I [Aliamphritea spongicola]